MAAILILLPVVVWVYAEFKCARAIRITLGLAAIVVVCVVVHFAGLIIPKYESDTHRSSLKLAGELMATAQTVRVQQAVEAYNGQASTSSTYTAAMEMWYVLNHGPRH